MLSGAFQADSMHLKHAHKLYDVKVVTLKSFYALNNSVATSFHSVHLDFWYIFLPVRKWAVLSMRYS